MLTEDAKGVFVISVTPFTDSGAVDLDGIPRLVDFYLRCGVHGLTILGIMGEANKLLPEEAEAVVDAFLRAVGGRVPVVVGASAPALLGVERTAKHAMSAGAAGVMVAPTPGLRSDDQTFGYLETVVRTLGADIPIVYQDYPQATGVFLTPALWSRMVAAFPSVVMLKHEDCPGLAKLSRVRADERKPGARRVSILVGNGGLYYPQELQRGADGAMTGYGYPEMLTEVWRLHAAGNVDGAEDLFDAHLPLVRLEQQPGIGVPLRKEILRRRGALASARARYPVPVLTAEDLAELDRIMARLERTLTHGRLRAA